MADQDVLDIELEGANGLDGRPDEVKLNGDEAAEIAADGTTKRKPHKVSRQNSKENMAATFVHGPRSWKNSRRSRNGHGRGLPKKGGAGGEKTPALL